MDEAGTAVDRRKLLSLAGATAITFAVGRRPAAASQDDTIRFGLTPVLLTSDLDLLDLLKSYLEAATGRRVDLVIRRTYQEITGLLTSGQLTGAWICSPPFCAHRGQLELLAVPVWRGRPLYQSYLIADAGRAATTIDALAGDVHAFSDPDSNSGYLVTAAELAGKGFRPERYFREIFFTYGHRNVVRAVAAGLAQSGSVDGYIYEVLAEVEPELVAATRIVRKSEWFGFPPIAGPSTSVGSAAVAQLTQALLAMDKDEAGREVLRELRLDAFAAEPAALYDPVAANMALVRSLA